MYAPLARGSTGGGGAHRRPCDRGGEREVIKQDRVDARVHNGLDLVQSVDLHDDRRCMPHSLADLRAAVELIAVMLHVGLFLYDRVYPMSVYPLSTSLLSESPEDLL